MVASGLDRFERWAAGDGTAGAAVHDLAATVARRRPSTGELSVRDRPRWERAVSQHLHRVLGAVDEVVRDATRWRLAPDPAMARMAMLLSDGVRRVHRGLVALAAGDLDGAAGEVAAVATGRSTYEELHARAAGSLLTDRDLIGAAVRIDQHHAVGLAFDEVQSAAERLVLAGASAAGSQPKRPET